jgi:hypothetical protein
LSEVSRAIRRSTSSGCARDRIDGVAGPVRLVSQSELLANHRLRESQFKAVRMKPSRARIWLDLNQCATAGAK